MPTAWLRERTTADSRARSPKLFLGLRRIPPWRYLLGFVLGGLALVGVLIEVEWPATWWLDDDGVKNPWARVLQVATAIVAGTTALVAPIKVGLDRVRRGDELDRATAERRLTDLTDTIFATIAEYKGEDGLDLWKYMTVRAFVVDRSKGAERLLRVADTRNHHRTTSGITWARGKGTVGTAWQDRTVKWINLRAPDYVSALQDERAWARLDADFRQGLDFDEASRLAAQGYGAVVAYPVVDRGYVYGMISVDVPPGNVTLLRDPELTRQVQRQIELARSEFTLLWEMLRP